MARVAAITAGGIVVPWNENTLHYKDFDMGECFISHLLECTGSRYSYLLTGANGRGEERERKRLWSDLEKCRRKWDHP